MNIEAIGQNTNNYNKKITESYTNNNPEFSAYLNDAAVMKNSDTTLSSDKIGANGKIASNYQPSILWGGVSYWDDQKLADHILRFEKVAINTNKPINWATTGEHKLTDNEIDILKNKYDVTNLSEQAFYDLMADLSQLNAIKMEDIVSRYEFKDPLPLFEGVMVYTGKITEMSYHDGKPMNDLLGELYHRVEYYDASREALNTTEFVRLNKILLGRNQHLLPEIKEHAQECCEYINRYYNIISQLART